MMLSSENDGRPITLGVVSFLNSRPLIEGLDANAGVSLYYAVPSALPGMLRQGEVDVALIPVIDLARAVGEWGRVSDACIGSDGETLTVRVFSRVPPERMTVLYVDEDSHTSVALARLIWSYHYDRRLTLVPLSAAGDLNDCESILLIGDKVVTAPLDGFGHEIDLGGAWKQWTGLPFVFAVWAAPVNGACGTGLQPVTEGCGTGVSPVTRSDLAGMLSAARDRGVARAAAIAAEMGPPLGWPAALAEEYLTRRLIYRLTPSALEGMRRFINLAAAEGIVPDSGALVR
jgi:chorismate dehydratase